MLEVKRTKTDEPGRKWGSMDSTFLCCRHSSDFQRYRTNIRDDQAATFVHGDNDRASIVAQTHSI